MNSQSNTLKYIIKNSDKQEKPAAPLHPIPIKQDIMY
jgi:hypothetical protein